VAPKALLVLPHHSVTSGGSAVVEAAAEDFTQRGVRRWSATLRSAVKLHTDGGAVEQDDSDWMTRRPILRQQEVPVVIPSKQPQPLIAVAIGPVTLRQGVLLDPESELPSGQSRSPQYNRANVAGYGTSGRRPPRTRRLGRLPPPHQPGRRPLTRRVLPRAGHRSGGGDRKRHGAAVSKDCGPTRSSGADGSRSLAWCGSAHPPRRGVLLLLAGVRGRVRPAPR
jgi:hypothetical protein